MATSQDDSSNRTRETTRAALLSVLSNSVLTVSKLAVGYATGSISVISEGVHSGNDLVAALLALFSVRKASQPADRGHAYGHGKFEAVSGAVEAALIMVVAVGIAYAAVRALILGIFPQLHHGPALAVMGLSMVVNIAVSAHLYRVAKRHESLALEADAAHLRTDVWTSGAVFLGLGVIYLFQVAGVQVQWIDPALGLVVAALIITQGSRIAREGLNQLLDRSLPEEEIAQIARKIQEHDGRFVEFHRLRSRRAGHERHIDLHLVVCDELTVAQAHDLTDHLEDEIASLFPGTQVMIHVEPCGDEACRRSRADGSWEFCAQQRKRAETPTSDS